MLFPLRWRVFSGEHTPALSGGLNFSHVSQRGCFSYQGTGGRSCHRGAPSKMWAWVSPSHQGETTHGADAPGGHL